MNNYKIPKEHEEAMQWMEEISPEWSKKDYPDKYIHILADRYNTKKFQKKSMRPKYKKGKKFIGTIDIEIEMLSYFFKNRDRFRLAFNKEIKNKIGEIQYKIYINILKNWIDGGRKNNPIILCFKKSIDEYLKNKSKRYYCEEDGSVLSCAESNRLSVNSIEQILELQSSYLETFFSEANDNLMSDYNIFRNPYLHRGINILRYEDIYKYYEKKLYYKELEILSSYSLSINVAEKFCLINLHYNKPIQTHKIILSSKYNNFHKRIIASSLLNYELDIRQLELLSIPSIEYFYLSYEGLNDNVFDFLIDKSFKEYSGGGVVQEAIEEIINTNNYNDEKYIY